MEELIGEIMKRIGNRIIIEGTEPVVIVKPLPVYGPPPPPPINTAPPRPKELNGEDMQEIKVNVDTKNGFHPPKIVIQENGKTILDMPADEFIAWVKAGLGQGPMASAFMEASRRPTKEQSS